MTVAVTGTPARRRPAQRPRSRRGSRIVNAEGGITYELPRVGRPAAVRAGQDGVVAAITHAVGANPWPLARSLISQLGLVLTS